MNKYQIRLSFLYSFLIGIFALLFVALFADRSLLYAYRFGLFAGVMLTAVIVSFFMNVKTNNAGIWAIEAIVGLLIIIWAILILLVGAANSIWVEFLMAVCISFILFFLFFACLIAIQKFFEWIFAIEKATEEKTVMEKLFEWMKRN